MCRMLLLMVVGAILVLSACPYERRQAQERAEQQATQRASAASSTTAADSGQGGVKPDAARGDAAIASKPETTLPAGWPASLPVYPGAKLTMAQSIGSGPTAALNIAMETSAAPGDLLRYYDTQAKAAGFANTMQINSKDGGGMYQYKSETQVLTVSVTKGSALTSATLALTAK